MRDILESVKLNAFLKTTGGEGLHVVVPVAPTVEWPQAKEFCKSLAEELAQREPKSYTTNMRKSERYKRVFIDYLRNGRTATAVVAYSVRWRPGAPVSMPIDWNELGRLKSASQFTVKTVPGGPLCAPHSPRGKASNTHISLFFCLPSPPLRSH